MISYTKLKSGEWGVRATGERISAGQSVSVAKKSGETRRETIGRVLWQGDGITLASILQSSGGTAYRRSGGCKGCGGAIVDAGHHRAMNGYCGHCAFDEFDC